jgi:hypothetical protein
MDGAAIRKRVGTLGPRKRGGPFCNPAPATCACTGMSAKFD